MKAALRFFIIVGTLSAVIVMALYYGHFANKAQHPVKARATQALALRHSLTERAGLQRGRTFGLVLVSWRVLRAASLAEA